MLDLRADHRALVASILARHVPGHEVRAFGSRARGDARPTSDLDLVIWTDEPLPAIVLARLKDDLRESDLPFRVDVLDRADLSPSFRRLVAREARPFLAAA